MERRIAGQRGLGAANGAVERDVSPKSRPSKNHAADLRALIDNEVIETRDIEYKRIVAVGSKADERKNKFLAGVSSFANTDGGDFIVGIRAENGIPKDLMPVERAQLDSLKLAIEQLIQTGIRGLGVGGEEVG